MQVSTGTRNVRSSVDVGTLVIHRPSSVPGRPWPDVRHSLSLDTSRVIGRREGYGSAQDAFNAGYYLTAPMQVGAAAIYASDDGRFRLHPVLLDRRTTLALDQLVRQHTPANVEFVLANQRLMAVVDGAAWVRNPELRSSWLAQRSATRPALDIVAPTTSR